MVENLLDYKKIRPISPDFLLLVVARRRKGRPGKACDRDHSWRAPAVVLVQYVEEADRA